MPDLTPRQRVARNIAETLKEAADRGRPAHLLIGAGCSKSAGIPLAHELIARILEKYRFRCENIPEGEQTYGRCMSLLSPNERRDLLSPYLKGARLNWGHLAIAQMIAQGLIERVLTVNFDNLLVRSCGLLGIYPAVYDFATAPTDNRSFLVSPAIVHLHGQGYGVRLMNTEEETRKHAEQIKPIVKASLDDHPLVVVGYSGNSDDLFSVFESDHRDHEKLYWLGYGETAPEHVARLLDGKSHATYTGGCDADLVLMDIAREAGCWPPQVFEDPAGHLLVALETVGPFPWEGQTPTVDLLVDLRTRLEDQREGLRRGSKVANLIMKGQVEEAATEAEASPRETSPVVRAWLLVTEATNILTRMQGGSGSSEDFESANAGFEEALRLVPDMHEALNNWGNLLLSRAERASDPAEAARYADEAAAKYEAALRIKPDMHEALNGLGALLLTRFHSEKANENKSALLGKAEGLLRRATLLQPTQTYNLACVLALKGDSDGCREKLRIAAEAGTLPEAEHLLSDPDLASVREEAWFKEVVEGRRAT